ISARLSPRSPRRPRKAPQLARVCADRNARGHGAVVRRDGAGGGRGYREGEGGTMTTDRVYEAYPLTWPPQKPRTRAPTASRFKVTLGSARDGLLREVELLGGKRPV